jgi:hypothetical protein
MRMRIRIALGRGANPFNGATEGDLYKKLVCTRNGYGAKWFGNIRFQ